MTHKSEVISFKELTSLSFRPKPKKHAHFPKIVVDKGANLLYNIRQRFNICVRSEVLSCFLNLNPCSSAMGKKND